MLNDSYTWLLMDEDWKEQEKDMEEEFDDNICWGCKEPKYYCVCCPCEGTCRACLNKAFYDEAL